MSTADRPSPPHRLMLRHNDSLDAVLAALRNRNAATVSVLASDTAYSRPTVTTALEELRSAAIANESSLTANGLGRPATTWRMRPDAGIVIGVDILATSMLLAVVDLRGHVLHACQHNLSVSDADQRLTELHALISDTANTYRDAGSLLAVGASVTGVVDAHGTIMKSDFVPIWSGFPLAQRLSKLLTVPIVVENDINMAAYGEYTLRYQEQRIPHNADLFLIQFTRGPRTGLIMNGQVHRGKRSKAGEISDLIDLHPGDQPDEDWINRTALTIASISAVLDPDLVVLSAANTSMREAINTITRQLNTFQAQHESYIHLEMAELEGAASVIGAVHTALRITNASLTGSPSPRPVQLIHTSAITHAGTQGEHSVMNLMTTTDHTDRSPQAITIKQRD